MNVVTILRFMATAAWIYASRHTELISDDITPEEANEVKIAILSEPIAATFAIPSAFVSPGIMNLSWLSVIMFGIILKRKHKEKFDKHN